MGSSKQLNVEMFLNKLFLGEKIRIEICTKCRYNYVENQLLSSKKNSCSHKLTIVLLISTVEPLRSL